MKSARRASEPKLCVVVTVNAKPRPFSYFLTLFYALPHTTYTTPIIVTNWLFSLISEINFSILYFDLVCTHWQSDHRQTSVPFLSNSQVSVEKCRCLRRVTACERARRRSRREEEIAPYSTLCQYTGRVWSVVVSTGVSLNLSIQSTPILITSFPFITICLALLRQTSSLFLTYPYIDCMPWSCFFCCIFSPSRMPAVFTRYPYMFWQIRITVSQRFLHRKPLGGLHLQKLSD